MERTAYYMQAMLWECPNSEVGHIWFYWNSAITWKLYGHVWITADPTAAFGPTIQNCRTYDNQKVSKSDKRFMGIMIRLVKVQTCFLNTILSYLLP